MLIFPSFLFLFLLLRSPFCEEGGVFFFFFSPLVFVVLSVCLSVLFCRFSLLQTLVFVTNKSLSLEKITTCALLDRLPS